MSSPKRISRRVTAGAFPSAAIFIYSIFPGNTAYSVEHGAGALPPRVPPAEASKKIYTRTTKAALPTSVDLGAQLPPIGNQGSTNSCVGWAVGYSLKTQQEQRERSWGITTTNHQFSPWWIYNQIKISPDQGSYIEDAYELVKLRGCDVLSNFNPGHPYTYPPNTSFPEYRIISWNYVARDLGSIKQIISEGRPIVISVNLFPDFDSLSSTNQVFDSIYGYSRGRHAICVTGYDDARQAVKFVNQWGTSWGVSGGGWISYAMMMDSRGVNEMYDAQDYDPSKPVVSVGLSGGIPIKGGGSTPPPPASEDDKGLNLPGVPAGFSVSTTLYEKANRVYFSLTGSAINGIDYGYFDSSSNTWSTIPNEGTFVVPRGGRGPSSGSITVLPRNDSLAEGDETVTLTILPHPSYMIGNGTATVVIRDYVTPVAAPSASN